MPTVNQLVKKGRKKVETKSQSILLENCPQKRGVCLTVTTTTPKNQTQLYVKFVEFVFQLVKKLLVIFQVKVITYKNTM